jgi:hypothetical protein
MSRAKLVKIAEIIAAHVSYFNGWKVSDQKMWTDCHNAALDILTYLECPSPRRRRAERKSK